MNKDQKSGALNNLKGRVKEAIGIVTGDKDKESEGAAERAAGAAKKAVGDLKHKVAKKIEE
jgi:uncharacterized protein YjbJ (UPF0337 family)